MNDYTCPTSCVEANHPGGEHEEWLAEHQPTAREAERCAAMFPCHPTPEFPCDNPGGDHRCALDKGHHGEHVTPGGWR